MTWFVTLLCPTDWCMERVCLLSFASYHVEHSLSEQNAKACVGVVHKICQPKTSRHNIQEIGCFFFFGNDRMTRLTLKIRRTLVSCQWAVNRFDGLSHHQASVKLRETHFGQRSGWSIRPRRHPSFQERWSKNFCCAASQETVPAPQPHLFSAVVGHVRSAGQ